MGHNSFNLIIYTHDDKAVLVFVVYQFGALIPEVKLMIYMIISPS